MARRERDGAARFWFAARRGVSARGRGCRHHLFAARFSSPGPAPAVGGDVYRLVRAVRAVAVPGLAAARARKIAGSRGRIRSLVRARAQKTFIRWRPGFGPAEKKKKPAATQPCIPLLFPNLFPLFTTTLPASGRATCPKPSSSRRRPKWKTPPGSCRRTPASRSSAWTAPCTTRYVC